MSRSNRICAFFIEKPYDLAKLKNLKFFDSLVFWLRGASLHGLIMKLHGDKGQRQ